MSDKDYRCRVCGSASVVQILDLGETPLANALLRENELSGNERTYPLDLVLCTECSLVQITETVPPEELFSEYLYFSSFSETMLRHSRTLVERLIRERGLDSASLAAEIASNDGYLLQFYRDAGIRVLGIEPARNIADVAREKGIETISEFFGSELGHRLAGEGTRVDVIHAHNVVAHVADLNGLAEGLQAMLKPDGVAVIEVPYIRDMIEGLEFDTIYHEHLCYFSLTALDRLFAQNELKAVHVERVAIHGGSLRLFVARLDSQEAVDSSVESLRTEERNWGVGDPATYEQFRSRVEGLKSDLVTLLAELKGEGKDIAAYGASAKGSTLLNYFGIGRETLDFVADRSTVKQGYYTPGTHLPIVDPAELLRRKPDYTLLLTWNFSDEILRQQQEYRDQGGRFIIPIPELRVA